MTIEQILDVALGEDFKLNHEAAYQAMHSAMKEYAQQISEKFLKWVLDKKLVPNSNGYWFDASVPRDEVRFYTIPQLYTWLDTGIQYKVPPLVNPDSYKLPIKEIHRCQGCGAQVVKGNDFCGECMCEDDSY